MKSSKKTAVKIAKVLFFIAIIVIIIMGIIFFSIYFSAKLDKNAIIAQKAKISLYDSQNNLVINDKLYKYVPYEEISQNVINAFVALEDKRFYNHNGVDYYRTMGALINDLKTLSFKEGGSTITQQLAKNTQLCNEKKISRKIKELRLARLIEKNYTKNQIMEMYLNAIYFGNGIYGIDSASKNYFGKTASNLTTAEGAMLAGIVKNPSKYSPKNNPELSTQRRNLVLKLMFEQGYITEHEFSIAKNVEFSPINDVKNDQICIPYYSNAIKETANILGITEKQVINSDYKIYTYYDKTKQSALSRSFNLEDFQAKNSFGILASRYALLSDNESGGIVACYSDFEQDLINFRRQPASVIKPIVDYAPAIEFSNLSPQSYVFDEKIEINGYSPNNYANVYYGWITLETALSKSVNSVALKLFNDIGKDKCMNFAKKCGLNFSHNDGNATSLGGLTDGLTGIEIAEAYMTLANNGLHKNNTFIRKITDKNGKILYENKKIITTTMSQDTAYLTTSMLENTVKFGTASKLKGFDYAIASKTGTSQSSKCDKNLDAWNVSYTTQSTLVVWYGDLQNSPETALDTTGSSYPTLMAKKIYSLLSSPQKSDFSIPNGIFSMEIDTYAQELDHVLYLTNHSTPDEYRKKSYFSLKNCPTALSPYFDINNVSFTIKNDYFNRIIEIYAEENYEYVLEEYDMFSSTTTEYAYKESGKYALPTTFSNKLYSYKLKIYYKNILLGIISPKYEENFIYDNHNELFLRRL